MTMSAIGDQDFGAGFIAFVIVVALGVSLYFLLRSMNRHLRKVPDSFDPEVRDDAGPPDAPDRAE